VKIQPITSKSRVGMSSPSPVQPVVYDPRWPSDHHPWRGVHKVGVTSSTPGEYLRWSNREVEEGERTCSNGLHVAADWPPCCKVELPKVAPREPSVYEDPAVLNAIFNR
jgi:hypothetical protein